MLIALVSFNISYLKNFFDVCENKGKFSLLRSP